MNEQELTDKAEAFVRDQGNTHSGLADRPRIICWMSSFAKAYADAETKELEEAYAELKSSYEKFYESDAVQHKQILALKAEIKRLREFAQQCFKSPEKLAVIHYFENGEFDYCDLVPLQDAAINSLSPAPVTEDKFSVSAYPKECVPTIEQLTESDDMTMVQRLEKRMPPFHKVASVTVQCPDILQTILALPDDTSAAYIKALIHDQLETK